jgi:predicted helicase
MARFHAHKEMKIPHPHQNDASHAVIEIFKIKDRASIVAPCGSGKSIIGVEVLRQLHAAKRVVFFAPSLALIGQTVEVWREEGLLSNRRVLCVCSDESLAEEDDVNQIDVNIQVTTDPDDVKAFLKTQDHPIIFCTYQSSNILKNGLPKKFSFDFGIFDEAHRTAHPDQTGTFCVPLDNRKIPIDKRLFMTATPKHYAITSEYDVPYSMDNNDVYGDRAYSMSIKDAIDSGIVCDYQVIVSVTTDAELRKKIGDHHVKNQNEDRFIAAAISIKKAMVESGAKKVFLFAYTVAEAYNFIHNETIQKELAGINLFHVSGKMTTHARQKTLKEFEESDYGLITNARCLSEGVDSPTVDMVVYISNKRSTIDIVQSSGRAMRRFPGKKYGYILLPIYIQSTQHQLKEAIQKTEVNYPGLKAGAWKEVSSS